MAEKFDPRHHIGKVYGIYTIVDIKDERDKYGHSLYVCRCNVCNKIFTRRLYKIKHTKKCRHARASWTNKRIGHIFNSMINRCYNANVKDYQWYGAKGIRVCKEWKDNPMLFEEWAFNNGYVDGLTIDRIESDKNYCPENCRWVSLVENSRRAGVVNWIKVDGKNMTGRQWSNYFNIGINAINKCVKKYGIDKTKELILAMLKESPSTKCRKPNQTWFEVYGIQV